MLHLSALAGAGALTMQEVRDQMLLNYDGRVRPALWLAETGHIGPVCPDAPADVVDVSMEVTAVPNVDQINLNFDVEGRFTATWRDERLHFDGVTQGGCSSVLSFDSADAAPIWKPSFAFHRAIASSIGRASDGHVAGDLARLEVRPNGLVMWQQAFRAKLHCEMHFGQLP